MPYEANSNFGPPPPLMFGGDIEIPNMDGSAMEAEEPHARECPSDLLAQQSGMSGLLANIFPSLRVHRRTPQLDQRPCSYYVQVAEGRDHALTV